MPIISSRRIGTAEYPDVEGIGLTCDWINRTYKKLGHTTRHWMNSGLPERKGTNWCIDLRSNLLWYLMRNQLLRIDKA